MLPPLRFLSCRYAADATPLLHFIYSILTPLFHYAAAAAMSLLRSAAAIRYFRAS